jgi:hypothetical protein
MQGYEFCACGTGMTDVSLPIFQVAVQKRRVQDDRRQDSFQLMAAASICVSNFGLRHIGTNSFVDCTLEMRHTGWAHFAGERTAK